MLVAMLAARCRALQGVEGAARDERIAKLVIYFSDQVLVLDPLPPCLLLAPATVGCERGRGGASRTSYGGGYGGGSLR